jgi:hypothetical protein
MLPLAMNEGGPVFAHSGHLDRKTRMRTSDPKLTLSPHLREDC